MHSVEDTIPIAKTREVAIEKEPVPAADVDPARSKRWRQQVRMHIKIQSEQFGWRGAAYLPVSSLPLAPPPTQFDSDPNHISRRSFSFPFNMAHSKHS